MERDTSEHSPREATSDAGQMALDARITMRDAASDPAVRDASGPAVGDASAIDASDGSFEAHDAGGDADANPPVRAPGCGRPHDTGRHMLQFDVDGSQREVLLYVPNGYTGETALPFTFNLHGSGSTPTAQQDATGIEPLADQKGMIVAAIAGYDRLWNVARDPVADGAHVWPLVSNTTEVVLDFLLAQPGR